MQAVKELNQEILDHHLAWQLQADEYKGVDKELSSLQPIAACYQFQDLHGRVTSFSLREAPGDGDCFFHAVNKPYLLTRESLVARLQESSHQKEVLTGFAHEVRQFLYLGYTNSHVDEQESLACQQLLTDEVKNLFATLHNQEQTFKPLINAARTELGNQATKGKLAAELLDLLSQSNSGLAASFNEAYQAIINTNDLLYKYCCQTSVFINYVNLYLQDARGYIPFARELAGEQVASTIDVINKLFNLNIQIFLCNRQTQLVLANQPQTGEYIPILHNGINHFSGLNIIPKKTKKNRAGLKLRLATDLDFWLANTLNTLKIYNTNYEICLVSSLPDNTEPDKIYLNELGEYLTINGLTGFTCTGQIDVVSSLNAKTKQSIIKQLIEQDALPSIIAVVQAYDYALGFALLNTVTPEDCQRLLDVFTQQVQPCLLQAKLGETIETQYLKLGRVLSKHQAIEVIEQLNALHISQVEQIALTDKLPTILRTFPYYSAAELSSIRRQLEGLLSRTKAEQYFASLEKLIHLLLLGYKEIDYQDCCALLNEAMHYSTLGLKAKKPVFNLLIEINFAYYFILHCKVPEQPVCLSGLYGNALQQISVLHKLFQAADLLVLHAKLLTNPSLILTSLRQAELCYQLIVLQAINYNNFSALGNQALYRLSLNKTQLLQLELKPSLFAWQDWRNRIDALRTQFTKKLDVAPLDDNLRLFQEFNQDLNNYLKELLFECIKFIGQEPSPYVLLAINTLAREEAGPDTKLQLALLVSEDNPWLPNLLKLVLEPLGEFSLISGRSLDQLACNKTHQFIVGRPKHVSLAMRI